MLVEAARLRDALHSLHERGFAHVPDAVSDAARADLIAAAPSAAEFALLPADDRPAVAELAGELIALVREHAEPSWGLDELDFNEVAWQRSGRAGSLPLGCGEPRYSFLVAEVTLEGQATLSVFSGDVTESCVLGPGDLALLPAPVPRHTFGPPCAGRRLSLSLRHNRLGPGGDR